MQKSRGKEITFLEACKIVYDFYLSEGYLGILGAGDAGDDWIFLQADSEDSSFGNKPIFFNKFDGSMRVIDYFNKKDNFWLNNAKKLKVPIEYTI